MKPQSYLFIFLLLACACKKAQNTVVAPVKYTTVSGKVYDRKYGRLLPNVNVAVWRQLVFGGYFAPLNESKIVASCTTNDSGYFQMNFADTIQAQSFTVTIMNKDLHGFGYNAVNLDQRNYFYFYADTIPKLYFHLHIINNFDTVHVIPDFASGFGDFYVPSTTLDTYIVSNIYPDTSFQILFSYNEYHGTHHDHSENITIGNYQDTFQRSLTIDPSTF